MNDETTTTTGDAIAQVVGQRPTPVLTPVTPITGNGSAPDDEPVTGNLIERLLKAPRSVAAAILDGKNLAAESGKLLLTAVVCYAAFGFAIGLFGGWEVARITVLKAPLVALGSMLLCFPSLFVFTAVSGSPITLGRAFALGAACLAMTGLILVGLAPVAWLFAISTNSLPFVTIMSLLVWLISLPFATRFLNRAQDAGLLNRKTGLNLWFVVFIAVMLQMTTVMRPILAKPVEASSWREPAKMFFIKHFGEAMWGK